MRCLLVYDIPDDRTRTKVADACLDYGLDRIQYSAFLGRLNPTHRRELMKKMRRLLGRRPGKIQLFPLCDRDWSERDEIIQEETDGGRRGATGG
ncbi:MAG: CRISPR-associated endonuclease Cas2 [Chloroflexi bacterium]|nr:MAG: CRISPR-associated endonuclease Cas2 [Chloroflexota bacterium]